MKDANCGRTRFASNQLGTSGIYRRVAVCAARVIVAVRLRKCLFLVNKKFDGGVYMLRNMYKCSCDAQTLYECGGMGVGYCEYAVLCNSEIHVALCDSRHEIPMAVNGSVFPEVISNPMGFNALYGMCAEALDAAVNNGVNRINVYVTGLTPALLTLINYCHDNGVTLITWHYDKVNGDYKPLPIR